MNAVSSAKQFIMNELQRSLPALFPGYFSDAKHKHYKDFSWPVSITNQMLFETAKRNGIAKAAVTKTKRKTWETYPQISENDDPQETVLEKTIRIWADDIGFWNCVSEADRRAMIARYSGFILRISDDKSFDKPVERLNSIEDIVELVPFWSDQLTVQEWEDDLNSDNYGKPKSYQFNEAAVGSQLNKASRQVTIHPDRVFIWSEDGTLDCDALIEAGYNALIDIEKVSGAGGEGFWKNAKSSPVLKIDKEAKIKDMAKAMGVPEEEIADKMDEQVQDWQKGFDAMLLLQGIEPQTLNVTLPNPEYFFNNPLTIFAASVDMPVKILMGNVTGERASTEDNKQWNSTCMARRKEVCTPRILEFIKKLEGFGILKGLDWLLVWEDLTASTKSEKIEVAFKMSDINSKMRGADGVLSDIVFTPDEMRAEAGYEPLSDDQIIESEEDDTDVDPPEPEKEEE